MGCWNKTLLFSLIVIFHVLIINDDTLLMLLYSCVCMPSSVFTFLVCQGNEVRDAPCKYFSVPSGICSPALWMQSPFIYSHTTNWSQRVWAVALTFKSAQALTATGRRVVGAACNNSSLFAHFLWGIDEIALMHFQVCAQTRRKKLRINERVHSESSAGITGLNACFTPSHTRDFETFSSSVIVDEPRF